MHQATQEKDLAHVQRKLDDGLQSLKVSTFMICYNYLFVLSFLKTIWYHQATHEKQLLLERKQLTRTLNSMELKHAKEFDAMKLEFHQIVSARDKRIKVILLRLTYISCTIYQSINNISIAQYLKSICDGNISAAAELQLAHSKLRETYEQDMVAKDSQRKEAIKSVSQRAVQQVSSLKKAISQKDKELAEVNDLAVEVADEFNLLDNQSKALARDHAKRALHHKNLADTRLQKLQYIQQVSANREACIESLKEHHDEEMASANQLIDSLSTQLRSSAAKVEGLEYELAEAVEEIDVRYVFTIQFNTIICNLTVNLQLHYRN